MSSTNSNSNLPFGSSIKLYTMVHGNRNLGNPIGHTPAVPSVTPFTVGSGPTPYNNIGFLDLPLVTQAFGAIPSGVGVAERNSVIQVQTSALDGPLEGGFY